MGRYRAVNGSMGNDSLKEEGMILLPLAAHHCQELLGERWSLRRSFPCLAGLTLRVMCVVLRRENCTALLTPSAVLLSTATS